VYVLLNSKSRQTSSKENIMPNPAEIAKIDARIRGRKDGFAYGGSTRSKKLFYSNTHTNPALSAEYDKSFAEGEQEVKTAIAASTI
jgi:hypothetical protein